MSRVSAEYGGDNPDYRVIRSVFQDVDGPVGKMLDRKSLAVLQEVQRTAPVRSGRLLATARRQYGVGARGPFWDVSIGLPGLTSYLQYLLYGSPPHVIRPRRRKALRFVAGGRVVFAKQVRHPGQRGDNFMVKALAKAR